MYPIRGKNKRSLPLICLILTGILILSILITSQITLEDQASADFASKSPGEPYVVKTETTFITGSTKATLLGTPESKSIYVSLPPEANVTSASM